MKLTFSSLQKHLFIFAVTSFFLVIHTAQAQTDTTQTQEVKTQRWLVETKDGSVFQGVFLWQDERGIRLLIESVGEVTIPASNIKNFKVLNESNFRNGEYWFENPNATRYFFSPSAFSLRKGEAYYQNTYIFLNSINYGVTDNFTIGGGFEILSTFSGNPFFFVTPKFSFPITEKVYAGTGLLLGSAPNLFDDESTGFGIGYGVLTYGNLDHNATLGLGYGYLDGSLSRKPMVTASGMTRISRKVGLVTENWFIPGDSYTTIISYGLRFMGERITVDLGFLNNSDIASDVIAIGIPYVDFVVKFGK